MRADRAGAAGRRQEVRGKEKTWSIKADYIEACSCQLFCSCYFNTSPDNGHSCEFNNAVKVSEGHVGDVKLDGVKFWMSGNLGDSWKDGEMDSAVITFDTAVKPEQQEALKFVIGKLYPVKWKSVATDTAAITWEKKGKEGHAKLGDAGEVTLTSFVGSDGKQAVINNLKYWGADSNTGFYLAKSEHHYKGHGHDYTFKDANGFFIHIESSGKVDEAPKQAMLD